MVTRHASGLLTAKTVNFHDIGRKQTWSVVLVNETAHFNVPHNMLFQR